MEESKEMLEKRVISGRNGKKKTRKDEKLPEGEVPEIKEPKEEEPDQYYAP